MAFTIPNSSGAGDTQAQVDKVDLDIIVAGMLGNGVFSGCGVASSGTGNGSSVVTAGQIRFSDVLITTTGPTLQHAANATGFDRFDLITVPSAGGVPVITAGTAAATPVFPSIPASSVCLYAVKIVNGHTTGTTIPASAYVDKRVSVAALGNWIEFGSVAWTASSVNPAVGNGTLSAHYARVGSTIHYKGVIAPGSTTTYGTGYWIVSMPVAATLGNRNVGFAGLHDSSTSGNDRAGALELLSSTTFRVVANGRVDSATPFTWASGDSLQWSMTYEAA